MKKPTYNELEQSVKIFKKQALAFKSAEESLQISKRSLGERVKELKCLYGISELIEQSSLSLNEIFRGVVNLIPPSWQYPEITCARIVFKDREIKTKNFSETRWMQSGNLFVQGKQVGSIGIYHLKEMPEIDEGPFLREERKLLDVIVERLGKVIERFQAEKSLKESEERYRVLTENVVDGVVVIQKGKVSFVNQAFAEMTGYSDAGLLIGTEAVNLISDDFKKDFQDTLNENKMSENKEETFIGKCVSPGGGESWIEGHYNIVTWLGAPAFLYTMRDVTEAKQREKEIEEQAETLSVENKNLRETIKDRYRFGNIIGKSPVMQELYEVVSMASASDANVVIYGESGTGKELVAHTIHDMSERKGKPFVPVNCGAIPEPLFESEFFGHSKGAFTGAYTDKHGFFDLADDGTLFMDEVGELIPSMQAKLLRAIEGGGYSPVGGGKMKNVNARLLAATNKNLPALLEKGLVREDFLYRIQVLTIYIPPLRDRKEDIPLIIEHFLNLSGKDKIGKSIPGNIMDSFLNHHWPGNVRELHNVLSRYLALNRVDFIQTTVAPENEISIEDKGRDPGKLSFHNVVMDSQKSVIIRALNQCYWQKSKTANMLGIDRKTLYRKMKHFGLSQPQYGAGSPHA